MIHASNSSLEQIDDDDNNDNDCESIGKSLKSELQFTERSRKSCKLKIYYLNVYMTDYLGI